MPVRLPGTLRLWQTIGNNGTQSQEALVRIRTMLVRLQSGKPAETSGQQNQRLRGGTPLYARSVTGSFASV